jgi:hypothetical protein
LYDNTISLFQYRLDREIELTSLFVTPLTYEGLIDEFLGIEHGHVNLDPGIIEDDTPEGGGIGGSGNNNTTKQLYHIVQTNSGNKFSFSLNNEDVMFSEIRNLSIDKLGAYLKEKSIAIKESYSSFRDNKDQSIADIHTFMYKKMPEIKQNYKSLHQHINIAAVVKNHSDSSDFRSIWQLERGLLEGDTSSSELLEDFICSDVDRIYLSRVLRLLCLQSLTSSGIRTAKLDSIRRLIVQTYGYEHLYTLVNLEKAGYIDKSLYIRHD